MASIEKYVPGIKKYARSVDEDALAQIVKHLGIALRSRDAMFVAGTDPQELKRVRESWLKKKLGLKASDAELDQAIHEVMQEMKQDRMKERVTVYYLLAARFKKLNSLKKEMPPAEKKIA